SELRFGMRNPINQLVVNKLSKPMRVRVRAFSLGALIPVATLFASAVLTVVTRSGGAFVGAFGFVAGVGYFASCVGVNGSFFDGRESSRARDDGRSEGACRSES